MKQLMPDIVDRKKLAIHECCHALLTRLFSDYLILSDVYIDPNGSSGKLGSNFVQSTSNVVMNTYPAMGIVWLAGVIGDTINNDGTEKILSDKQGILENRKMLDWKLGGEDEPQFGFNATYVSTNYGLDFKKYEKFCLSFAIDFLSDKEVWGYVQQLSAALLAKPDLKLISSELNDFFQKSGFDQFVATKKAELIERLGKMKKECEKDDPYANYDFTEYPLP
jgi:hypothetical protein